jgi:gamma-glutamyl-gamma-aminobutyraldehyde dehydrogenase
MLDVTHEEWLRRAKSLDASGAHHIDGADEGGGGAVFASHPVTARCSPRWPTGAPQRWTRPWPPPTGRGRVLLRIAELLEERREEVVLTVSLEMGKPITDAYQIGLRAVINTFRWYGQLAVPAHRRVPAHRAGRPRPR